MGRRYLKNLDERILQATVKLGAKYFNVMKVTAKEVGSLVDVTDATVFEHFQTKDNLLYQAYLYAQNHIVPYYEILAEAVKSVDGLNKAWLTIFNQMLANPDEAVYYAAYRFTAATNSLIDFGENTMKYAELVKETLVDLDNNFNENDYLSIFGFVISSTVHFVRMISIGVMEPTEKNKDLIFNLINGFLLRYSKK